MHVNFVHLKIHADFNCCIWPEKLDTRPFDLRPLIDTTVYDQVVQRYYTSERLSHNALNDAQAYRLGWAWMDANKEPEPHNQ